MEFKNPIETARAILERDILSEDNSTDTEDCVECNEEETVEVEETVEEGYGKVTASKKDDKDDEEDVDEANGDDEDEDDDEEDVEEGKVPPQFLKKNGKKNGKDDSDDDDEEEVDEAAVILDVDDNQDAEGKKATSTAKGKNRMKDADRKGKAKTAKGGVPEIQPKGGSQGNEGDGSGKVKEHIDALFNGEELTEEFRDKATTIFEAAVNERITAIEEDLVAQYNEKLEEGIETVKTELTEKLDDYLGYVVEEWMKENAVAIENGLKNEIAENFITGLKSLFESCYIDVPDAKYDVLTDYANKVNSLEEDLNAEMEKSINLRKELLESKCGEVFNGVVDGLVDTEVEKLRSLSEGLEFESVEQYEEKLKVIKENYFTSSTAHETNEPIINNDEKPQGVMGLYTEALSRTNKNQ